MEGQSRKSRLCGRSFGKMMALDAKAERFSLPGKGQRHEKGNES